MSIVKFGLPVFHFILNEVLTQAKLYIILVHIQFVITRIFQLRPLTDI